MVEYLLAAIAPGCDFRVVTEQFNGDAQRLLLLSETEAANEADKGARGAFPQPDVSGGG